MPQLSIHTIMLKDLVTHHQSTWQQRFWQHATEILSDISETDVSDSSQPSLFGSPISIDTPDIMVSSDISMHSESDRTSAASISSSDSDVSITNFEAEYYRNWRRWYHELVRHISTAHVLQQAPPVPKSLQLHLLDHWRLHSPERFCRKLQVEPETFNSLVALIIDNLVFTTIPTVLNS